MYLEGKGNRVRETPPVYNTICSAGHQIPAIQSSSHTYLTLLPCPAQSSGSPVVQYSPLGLLVVQRPMYKKGKLPPTHLRLPNIQWCPKASIAAS